MVYVCQEARAAGCDVWQVVSWFTRPLYCSVTYPSSLLPVPLAAHRPPDLHYAPQLIGQTLVYQVSARTICLDTPAL